MATDRVTSLSNWYRHYTENLAAEKHLRVQFPPNPKRDTLSNFPLIFKCPHEQTGKACRLKPCGKHGNVLSSNLSGGTKSPHRETGKPATLRM